MRWKPILPAILVVAGVAVLTSMAATSPVRDLTPPGRRGPAESDALVVAAEVDQRLLSSLKVTGLSPAERADDLTILRRLTLALMGTIPSLEEIRRFESDDRPDRLAIWTNAILDDPRFHNYFAERLARAFVGVEGGQFIIFRRDRFTNWLSEQLRDSVPYDRMVRSMLAEDGVWTDRAAVNYVTAGVANEEFDANKLAGRTVRAFLGQRIDCAQCHNHPFAHWKQTEFEGLAACFGQLDYTMVGVVDRPSKKFEVEDRETLEKRQVTPQVPFHPEWCGTSGSPRDRLAEWVTHPENRRFERAIVNRIWGLMFGQPFLTDRSVDDLPDPDDPTFQEQTAVLDLLGADFRSHRYQLKRLIRVMTSTEAFRRSSVHAVHEPAQLSELESHWAIFPLCRLRPEQVIGAMLQSNSVKTIDQNSHLFTRAIRLFRENDYIKQYGDPGEAELEQRTATITQTLLNMNGEFAREMSKVGPFSTPGTIRQFSPTREALLDNVYLTCLTRRPTEAERAHFAPQLGSPPKQPDQQVLEDIFWTLYNSPEFTWNH